MTRRIILLLFALGNCLLLSAMQKVKVTSPDRELQFVLTLSENRAAYSIIAGKKTVIEDSRLGFVFEDGTFDTGLRMGSITRRGIDETYSLAAGKVSEARARANEVVIPLYEPSTRHRLINLVVRAFNEGIAFRYEFPQQPNWTSYKMKDELTAFDLTGNPQVLGMPLPGYRSTHENLYDYDRLENLREHQLYEMPVTFAYDDLYVAILEAAVRDYPGMYLCREEGHLLGKLSPRIDRPDLKAIADEFPHRTPWRVISIGRRVGDLLESNILTHLNEPCTFDTSWIHPCKTTFTWWNGNVVPDTVFSPGNNFETNKYYIDFAKRHKIDLHGIYGYAETPWYYDDGFNFGWPGQQADVTRPVPCLDMPRIADYARGQGVGIHLWVHWKPLYEKLEQAMTIYEQWGVKGMMVDFMDRDDQEMIQIQEAILAAAARHHIFIQFHGASKPSGLNRTYPNEFTREGTLNYEVCKWEKKVTPDHDIAIPFTRMLAGSTDYHLGGFRAVKREEFTPKYINPCVMGTRGHMLAMYVVLENQLGMLCDKPEAYEQAAGFDFLCIVPQTWDEIKVPYALLNESICIARRSKADWYIGAITNHTPRTITVALDFLGEGRYEAQIWADVPGEDPNALQCTTQTVTRNDSLRLNLLRDGGVAIRIATIEKKGK